MEPEAIDESAPNNRWKDLAPNEDFTRSAGFLVQESYHRVEQAFLETHRLKLRELLNFVCLVTDSLIGVVLNKGIFK